MVLTTVAVAAALLILVTLDARGRGQRVGATRVRYALVAAALIILGAYAAPRAGLSSMLVSVLAVGAALVVLVVVDARGRGERVSPRRMGCVLLTFVLVVVGIFGGMFALFAIGFSSSENAREKEMDCTEQPRVPLTQQMQRVGWTNARLGHANQTDDERFWVDWDPGDGHVTRRLVAAGQDLPLTGGRVVSVDRVCTDMGTPWAAVSRPLPDPVTGAYPSTGPVDPDPTGQR